MLTEGTLSNRLQRQLEQILIAQDQLKSINMYVAIVHMIESSTVRTWWTPEDDYVSFKVSIQSFALFPYIIAFNVLTCKQRHPKLLHQRLRGFL